MAGTIAEIKRACVTGDLTAAITPKELNLETAVECARQRRDRRVRQDAPPPQATACKKEQRRMARRARCWRVHSDVTSKVNAIEDKNLCANAASRR
jgi:hypothetical protein